MLSKIHSYPELQKQVHNDLRIQHPEWVKPNGDCPTCESYELRLVELLGLSEHAQSCAGVLKDRGSDEREPNN